MSRTKTGTAALLGILLAMATGLALGAACQKVKRDEPQVRGGGPGAPGSGAPLESTASTPGAVSTPGEGSGAGAPKGAGGACDQYRDALCKAAGEQSNTCQSVKTTVAFLPAAACELALKDIGNATKKISGQREKCEELVTKLCADLGPDTQTCKMVKGQTPRFPPERCAMMMGRYDQVLAELKGMEEANKPLSDDKKAMIAADSPSSFGPKDAKVVLVEFSDFECPFCTKAADMLKQVKEKYAGKVRIVFRHFPLPMHQKAGPASQASLAAAAQGKFWEYHDLLFANQRALDRPNLEKFAQDLKLDMVKFKKALDDKTYEAAVNADMEIGKKVAVRGTPTVFVNGERVQNAVDFKAISKNIDDALAKAK